MDPEYAVGCKVEKKPLALPLLAGKQEINKVDQLAVLLLGGLFVLASDACGAFAVARVPSCGQQMCLLRCVRLQELGGGEAVAAASSQAMMLRNAVQAAQVTLEHAQLLGRPGSRGRRALAYATLAATVAATHCLYASAVGIVVGATEMEPEPGYVPIALRVAGVAGAFACAVFDLLTFRAILRGRERLC